MMRVNSFSKDFSALIIKLDEELKINMGEEKTFFDQYNKIDKIYEVVIAYSDGKAVGCGAIKKYADKVAEIKRMYVAEENRGQKIAQQILTELEAWAKELNYTQCILETYKKQSSAIKLYQNAGYKIISNYGQYTNSESSICMEKFL